jgi:hypothetical protein
LSDFVHFFSLIKGPEGLGMYRPLTIQVFYFLAWKVFNLNPIGLHIISFLFLFGILHLISKLMIDLGGNKKSALIAVFLYAVSATHFGHLYYLATFQEVAVTLFVLLCCLNFIRQKWFLSLGSYVLALMSKETAVITPILIGLIFLYQKNRGLKVGKIRKFIWRMVPFLLILGIYMSFRFFSYGFATGDSYVWDFSIRKLANTLTWYLGWSLNLPETLIDFVGPGLQINPNLFKYWSEEIIPILSMFLIEALILLGIFIKSLSIKKGRTEIFRVIFFSAAWFTVSLLPVAFLPIHKFTFYLTLPLIGIVFTISYLTEKSKINQFILGALLTAWALLSILTLKHTVATNWITQGQIISLKAYVFFRDVRLEPENFTLIDTPKDEELPWSPTQVVKIALSDKNFFAVFYPSLESKVQYGKGAGKQIESRQFLPY